MVYGRTLSTDEIIAKVENVDAAGITRTAARIFASAPTLAALGNLKKLEGLETIAARLN